MVHDSLLIPEQRIQIFIEVAILSLYFISSLVVLNELQYPLEVFGIGDDQRV
jgi:hypothetical protein